MNPQRLLLPGLLDALQVGVLLTDSRGRPTRANLAARRLLGCREDGSLAPKDALAVAAEALGTGATCEHELMVGQTTVLVRAVPLAGGALLELVDVSGAHRLHQAYREVLAAIGDSLLARVEPLGLLVEILSAADDPTTASRIMQQLRADANALVGLINPQTTAGEQTIAPGGAGMAGSGIVEGRPRSAGAQAPARSPADQPTVLLVHPAEGLRNALTIGLSQAGPTVIAARDLHEALEIVATMTLNCIVLDCGRSGLTAVDAYGKLRTVTEAPVLLLDGGDERLAETVGRPARDVVGLRRPLRFAELITAIEAVLNSQLAMAGATGAGVLAVGEVVLDERAHVLRVRGEPMELPIKEFELLRVLLAHAGRAISRERVIELVWGSELAVGRRNLHTYVKRLRHRIERDPANPEYLVTIRGFGYRFNLPGQGEQAE